MSKTTGDVVDRDWVIKAIRALEIIANTNDHDTVDVLKEMRSMARDVLNDLSKIREG